MAELKEIFASCDAKMTKAYEHFEGALDAIRAGKASVNVLNGVMVENYGMQMPVNQVASVSVPDAKTVLIQPWDKGALAAIEKAIINSNIGLTPSNNGEQIRLNIPPLTEERRKTLSKDVKGEGESVKIQLRNCRREGVDAIKKAQKDGLAEDMAKDGENEIQKMVDKFTKLVDQAVAAKDKEIMTV